MHQHDLNRVLFYPAEDMAGGDELSKGEKILRAEIKSSYSDVNEVIELYNIKKYFDNELYLKRWTQEEIEDFKQKAKKYSQIVGNYFSTISDENVIKIYEQTLHDYIHSFWEIVCNYSRFKRISKSNFSKILENEPHLIHEILTHKVLVTHYDKELKDFLLNYPASAEILLSVYETEVQELKKNQKYIPKSLTISDKESITSKYLDSADINLNYIGLIENARNRNDFRISDKTRLKAKRLYKSEMEKIFADKGRMSFGVSVDFLENTDTVVDSHIDDKLVAHYTYSADFIKKNNHPYQLFQNFKLLFEFVDNQNRINLVSKKSQLGLFEKIMGVHSQNEYKIGSGFCLLEMTSCCQIDSYNKIITELNTSLEDILHFIYTKAFQELYGFADNARFSIPKRVEQERTNIERRPRSSLPASQRTLRVHKISD